MAIAATIAVMLILGALGLLVLKVSDLQRRVRILAAREYPVCQAQPCHFTAARTATGKAVEPGSSRERLRALLERRVARRLAKESQ